MENSSLNELKKLAALEAIKFVESGQVVGLGSGSTVAFAIEEIGRRVREEGLKILGVPTSLDTYYIAVRNHVPLTTLDEHPVLDLAIDGADQVDHRLNMIKGRGAALTREKIVASRAKKFIVMIDARKLTRQIGEGQPLPVEVVPFAVKPVSEQIEKIGGKPRLRYGVSKLGPVITDNGNYILDVDFGVIRKPRELSISLKLIPGVVETGLFIDMADVVCVAGPKGVSRLVRER
jgi:ribose 5-phosphate isomerase A